MRKDFACGTHDPTFEIARVFFVGAALRGRPIARLFDGWGGHGVPPLQLR